MSSSRRRESEGVQVIIIIIIEVTTIELKDAPFRMCLVPKDLWTFRNSMRGVAVGRDFGDEMEAGEGKKVEVEVVVEVVVEDGAGLPSLTSTLIPSSSSPSSLLLPPVLVRPKKGSTSSPPARAARRTVEVEVKGRPSPPGPPEFTVTVTPRTPRTPRTPHRRRTPEPGGQ